MFNRLKIYLFTLVLFLMLAPSAFASDAIISIDTSGQTPLSQLNQASQSFSFFNSPADDKLLTAEQAFRFSAEVQNNSSIILNWKIADGYYLYQEKISVSLLDGSLIELPALTFPKGIQKHDEIFGDTLVYYHELNLNQPLLVKTSNSTKQTHKVALSIAYQGCAEIGVCYPPMKQTVTLNLSETGIEKSNPAVSSDGLSEQNLIARSLVNDSALWVSLSFLGFGLLLAFTPCIFPMIPILSGIIVGHGDKLTTRKAFFLSLSYVLASAITYAIFGVLAGLFGSNLQASFQNPWIIGSFSLLFVILALSMFGLYQIQLPSSLQSKLAALGHRDGKGSLINSALMGALSTLIVGPCVAAPLAGALIYIGQTGDALLGGFALFSLGLGMGAPLIVIGLSAGKLLPKAGHWMEPIKYFFGVLLIAVAITLVDRIIPANITMLLWAGLLIICSMYLRANNPQTNTINGWQKLSKGLGTVFLVYGIILIVGAAAGGTNPFQPLATLNINGSSHQQSSIKFQTIKSPLELDNALLQATEKKQLVMLDFYADWCVACKEMEYYTFASPLVKNAVKNILLLQIDVTKNSDLDRELLNRFSLVGPPAILFFAPRTGEIINKRIVGYMDAATFSQHLNSLNK